MALKKYDGTEIEFSIQAISVALDKRDAKIWSENGKYAICLKATEEGGEVLKQFFEVIDIDKTEPHTFVRETAAIMFFKELCLENNVSRQNA